MSKRILVLTTGGTISSIHSNDGLIPSDSSLEIAKLLNDDEVILSTENIMVLDSSNIQPEEWQVIARIIYHNMNLYDGIIVTHGTDTMAYTSSMMCFMIQNPKIPIVFTGSQLPLSHPLTDAISNLRYALAMAKSSYRGVYIAFDRKIILGCRAVKVRTSGFAAFESINLHSIGKINSNGLNIHEEYLPEFNGETRLVDNIETNVFLLKLTPTTNPSIMDLLIESGIKGIVIEAYGAGGISFVRRDFISKIKKATSLGIPVILCSQCLYESSNFNVYEVGTKALESGAVEALDMTTESAVCKLMYSLGQSSDIEEVKKIFRYPLSKEIAKGE